MRIARAVSLVLFLLPGFAAAQTPDPAAKVDEIFAEWRSAESPGCTVAVAEKGRTLLSRAYGMADLEHDVPITTSTVFEAGSVSKQLTAAAVLLLVQQGKLSLSDDVRKYVPELPDYGKTITIEHLIHHTSGLRDWGAIAWVHGWPRGTRIYTHAHMLDIASRQKELNYEPGAEFGYTNTGYNLLVVIVDRVSGQSFAEFSRKNIFEPLGMKRTEWRDDFTRVVKGRAVAYVKRDDGFHSEMPFENIYGNGGLMTTSEDLLLWNENFIHGKVGGTALIEAMERRGRLNDGREIEYAGGLFMLTYEGLQEISHNGATGGYRAYLGRFPEQGFSVAALCNLGDTDPEGLGRRVADLFLTGKKPAAAPAPAATVELPAGEISSKAGVYRNLRTSEALRLEVKEGKLHTGRGLLLLPLSTSLFQIADLEVKLDFITGPAGTTGLRVLYSNGDAVPFERVAEGVSTADQLAEYAGEYRSEEAEVTYRIVLEDGKLVVKGGPDISVALTPLYADGFKAGDEFIVRFTRNGNGKISGLTLSFDRVRALRFERR
ncbi:MAG TPA: serine hydrolase domain-containing protein [Thermoanaerobaculia bacterium]|nr:serine hydrolase domain-containing protein [Thermoanaerobaculia bacterium]